DVGAHKINEEMKKAAVKAIAGLAHETTSDVVARAYGGEARPFGPKSLIPSPFDPRLILRIAPAVAQAAMDSGVAGRPLEDLAAYTESLDRFVHRSGLIMKPLFSKAKENPKRVIYAEGEDERVLRAVQAIVEDRVAKPILVGRPRVVETRLKRFGLSFALGRDVELIDPEDDPRYRAFVQTYLEVAGRRGITPDAARTLVRTNSTIIGAIAVRRGEADALICGLEGRFETRLRIIRDVIGLQPGIKQLAAMSLIITNEGPYFLADTHVRQNPTAEEIAEIAQASASHVARFGITPKIALLSHSDFGQSDSASAVKMREALALIEERNPSLQVDGEMQADSALSEMVRDRVMPGSRLKGAANVLVFPNLDAANIAFQFAKVLADALPVGPLLIGPAKPAHILTPSVTARGIVNVTAAAVVEAQAVDSTPRDGGEAGVGMISE
ncbi:MAG: NADP-dependent malic enzyme, partial [Parafilimonas terrae]|nr:NADP-dependent malic enzyme [Parafilimonas terrae]